MREAPQAPACALVGISVAPIPLVPVAGSGHVPSLAEKAEALSQLWMPVPTLRLGWSASKHCGPCPPHRGPGSHTCSP